MSPSHRCAIRVLFVLSCLAAAPAWVAIPPTITDPGTLGGSNSHATPINDIDQVVAGSEFIDGSSVDHAFLYSGGI